jgi:predicted  nucleic acid-binding Zn-ribbon protein
MTDQQHDLLVLQQHDTAVDRLRHRRATLPERTLVEQLTAEQATGAAELGKLQPERDDRAAAQARLEAEVAGVEDKRRTLERRLSATSVPREAQTMSAEIDGLKARQSSLEDQIMDIMEALEPLEARLAAAGSEQEERAAQMSTARAALAAQEAAIDGELRAATAAREDAVRAVAPALLARYERLRASRGGVAVATLDGGRCTGCNLALPTAELERVRRAGSDALVECEQCGRILVR